MTTFQQSKAHIDALFKKIRTAIGQLPPLSAGHVRLYRYETESKQETRFGEPVSYGVEVDKFYADAKGCWFAGDMHYPLSLCLLGDLGYPQEKHNFFYADVTIEEAQKYYSLNHQKMGKPCNDFTADRDFVLPGDIALKKKMIIQLSREEVDIPYPPRDYNKNSPFEKASDYMLEQRKSFIVPEIRRWAEIFTEEDLLAKKAGWVKQKKNKVRPISEADNWGKW